jgi:hypothetical protein
VKPPPGPPKEGDVAVPGGEGAEVEQLLSRAQAQGARVLADVTRRAVERAILRGGGHLGSGTLYDADERAEVAEMLAAVTGTANLLGRARVRRRQAEVLAKVAKHAEPRAARFDEGGELRPLAPERAAEYFRQLIPTLGVDPQRFGADQRRRAFTLAAATERQVVEKVQRALQEAIDEGVADPRAAVERILDAAGVTPRNSGYADMVTRTNLADAYNTGQADELQDPDVIDTFPVWRYDGIRDGRQGADHEPHFDNYYPSSVPFAQVRGGRVFNCRCMATPVDRWAWADLKAAGARVADGYPEPQLPDEAPKPKRGGVSPEEAQAAAVSLQGVFDRVESVTAGQLAAELARVAKSMTKAQLAAAARAAGLVGNAAGMTKAELEGVLRGLLQERRAGLEARAADPIPPAEKLPPAREEAHGVPVEHLAGTTGDFRAGVADALRSLPPPALRYLAARGGRVVTAPRLLDAAPELAAGGAPRGWPAGMTWENVGGVAGVRGGAVVSQTYKLPNGVAYRRPAAEVAQTTRHETGHVLDEKLDHLSGSRAFAAAHAADAAGMASRERERLAYFLQEGEAGRSEAFAEAFAALHGGGPAGQADFLERFPRVAAFLKSLLVNL